MKAFQGGLPDIIIIIIMQWRLFVFGELLLLFVCVAVVVVIVYIITPLTSVITPLRWILKKKKNAL